jgi:hypothetical protein
MSILSAPSFSLSPLSSVSKSTKIHTHTGRHKEENKNGNSHNLIKLATKNFPLSFYFFQFAAVAVAAPKVVAFSSFLIVFLSLTHSLTQPVSDFVSVAFLVFGVSRSRIT